jgi:hypothetical protein
MRWRAAAFFVENVGKSLTKPEVCRQNQGAAGCFNLIAKSAQAGLN